MVPRGRLSFDSTDRGAWPFFVDGVTCLVISVSVCEEERKRREKMKEKRREKMKGKMKKKMKRDRGERRDFLFLKKFRDPQIRQMI